MNVTELFVMLLLSLLGGSAVVMAIDLAIHLRRLSEQKRAAAHRQPPNIPIQPPPDCRCDDDDIEIGEVDFEPFNGDCDYCDHDEEDD